MTSVFYEDIKLSDNSVASIAKCELLSQGKERKILNQKRKDFLLRISQEKIKQGNASVKHR